MSNQAYPLHWPLGWPRTPLPVKSAFASRSVDAAVSGLKHELSLLGATGIVISSNVSLGGGQPKDKGVCVYFTLKGKPYALPCDKWNRIEDNLWALAKHVESLRGQERWGVGTIERAFAGYMALGDGKRTWRELLAFPAGFNPSRDAVIASYRGRAVNCHPDKGGDQNAMAELNAARDAAFTELGF